jgi:hypothetical protein
MSALGFRAETVPTYRAALYPGDPERTMHALKESARRNVRRGVRLGLRVQQEESESFVDEHYDQIREVYVRGGNMVNFKKRRVLECFRSMRASGNLLALGVYLPDEPVCIATGMFLLGRRELLLWTWAHRTQYRWYRPTELMTWTAMQRAIDEGCESFDLMGRGDFKAKFGASLDERKCRWVRSRHHWLTEMRDLAEKGQRWRQSLIGRIARLATTPAVGDGAPVGAGGGGG